MAYVRAKWFAGGADVADVVRYPVTFVPAAGEAAGPRGDPREGIGGPAASPAAGTNATY